MRITTTRTSATVTRSFKITEGCPIVGMAYASPPKKVRIEHVVIAYRWADGAWIVESCYSVDIKGTVLKQDGTDSKNNHKRSPSDVYQLNGPADLADRLTDEFQWLAPIINLLRPTGNLSMMILNDAEVNG